MSFPSAVYLTRVRPGFEPTSPLDLPHELLHPRLYVGDLTTADARGMMIGINKCQIQRGLPNRQWAIAITGAIPTGKPMSRYAQHQAARAKWRAAAEAILGHSSADITRDHCASPSAAPAEGGAL